MSLLQPLQVAVKVGARAYRWSSYGGTILLGDVRNITATVFVAAVALLSVCSAHAAFPGSNGRIVFAKDVPCAGNPERPNCEWDLFTMNPDGSDVRPVTHDVRTFDEPQKTDFYPAWSPDGKKIAFISNRANPQESFEIFVVNADGTGLTQLTHNTSAVNWPPAWSPDGTELVFFRHPYTRGPGCNVCFLPPSIHKMKADGSGVVRIAAPPETGTVFMDWSPDGTKIVLAARNIWTMRPDGSGLTKISGESGNHQHPDWSPNGAQIVAPTSNQNPDPMGLPCCDIALYNANGSNLRRLTNTPELDESLPAWSPDGTKIVFGTGGEVAVVRTDGTDRVSLQPGYHPDWQPRPVESPPAAGYVRPKGASPFRVSLVPAYNTCTTPNSTHGSPLSSSSCTPPLPSSTSVTVGTMDVNGADANSRASIRLTVQRGDPGPPEDSDVLIQASVSDARCQPSTSTCGSVNSASGPDYIGELLGNFNARITDRLNEGSGGEPVGATVVDIPFPFQFECASTSSTDEGALCSGDTSFNAVVPGIVKDGTRAIWELTQGIVTDGGPDGATDTTPNTTFMRQGVFVP